MADVYPTKKRILLVDDDADITEILEFNLRNEGFETESVSSSEEALTKDLENFDLILLDIMMSGMSGYKFAETIRGKDIQTPIIFLTAKNTENDLLTGFSLGADDYIPKPFSIKEVIARVKAVLKRTENADVHSQTEERFVTGDFEIDFNLKEVLVNKEKIALTKTEFEILSLLAQKSTRIFSRAVIIDLLWSDAPYITERTVDVHVARLRKKLGAYGGLISNRQGYGYFFNSPEL